MKDSLLKSLSRGLAVLSRLHEESHGLSLQRIAAACDLRPSTAHNLLRTLTATGFAERMTGPVRYRLGPAARRLGGAARGRWGKAEAPVAALATRHSEATVTVAEPVDGRIVKVLRAEGGGPVDRPQGSVLAFYTSASGLAFQAFCTDERRDEYRRRHPFWEEAAVLWQRPEALDRFLEEARCAGHVEAGFPGDLLFKAAAPIYGRGGELRGVLGAALPSDSDASIRDAAVADLKRIAREVSELQEERT
jgi:DNA-binding IclR family transcriptional regulator